MTLVFINLYLSTAADASAYSDPSEILELSWSFVRWDMEGKSLDPELPCYKQSCFAQQHEEPAPKWTFHDKKALIEELHRGSALVIPSSGTLTPKTSTSTGITWRDLEKSGLSLQQAVQQLDDDVQRLLVASGLQFHFLVFDSWDLRVTLVKQATVKQINLPDYLMFPRFFELRDEYAHMWPSSEPITTLEGLCEALRVADAKGVNKGRAAAMVVALRDCLVALTKRCPGPRLREMFVRSRDARADIVAFNNDNSSVLYLSNLSPDTTQEELETWLYSVARPIALWTLKNVDSAKPVEAGFAVFATHEEANTCLKLNGHVLNGRVIKVAPSSEQVLQHAQEILAQFPAAKNKPRPGDWSCPSCGFLNFQRRMACFRCSYPVQATNQVNTIQMPMDYTGYLQRSGSSTSTSAGTPSMYSNPQQQQQQQQHQHQQHQHQQLQSHPPQSQQQQSFGAVVPFRAGDWKCGNEDCNYHNFAKNQQCLRCGASRLTAALIGDANNTSASQFYPRKVPYLRQPQQVQSFPLSHQQQQHQTQSQQQHQLGAQFQRHPVGYTPVSHPYYVNNG